MRYSRYRYSLELMGRDGKRGCNRDGGGERVWEGWKDAPCCFPVQVTE